MYGFRPLTRADIAIVNDWITRPHVAEWWIDSTGGPSEPLDDDILTEPDFNTWIVGHDGRDFAYMQDYNPHLYPNHHFAARPHGTRGIDQIIGEVDMISIGHGSAFIRQRVEALFQSGVTCVATDPHPANARAIRAYEKAGFTAYREIISPEWGPSLLMECLP